MQKPSIPPYKPSPEIQEKLQKLQQQAQQESGQRRRTAVLPKRSWIQRNPRLFQITFITTSLLVLFSKPLYDAFIADPIPLPRGGAPPPHKR
ncbi:PREDICTED: uncharacterized protein LOC108358770 [Rhagoletis zephyria]|uniref:uncharacterized protein LOC108358770 n=1 Tax=Rhagoletis zephyria TaxID=28612 RepID=UPI0008118065|nr:PREDICTED: uncharacterized protein LOC108358770 [Rhagoletis zephyria]XP_036333392.1 uncharacterized protein LOC118744466 [Rhagoletis pomonella]